MSKMNMKDPTAGNELSYHLFSVHGGWYEDALSYQILKTVKLVSDALSLLIGRDPSRSYVELY